MKAPLFQRHIPLLNMSLSCEEDRCAARWLAENENSFHPANNIIRLHQQISQLWQTPWVASFMGGRAALFAIIKTLELNAGDKIIIPAFTCQCVTNAISFHGIEILFADIETDTYGLSAAAVEKILTPRTKAILIQYTFGLVCRDIDQLLTLARQHGLWIIEDCAHATGGSWQNKLLGTVGDIAFFSSERSKIVNTIHGGWVITANRQLGERLHNVYAHTSDADPGYIRRLLQTLRHAYAGLQGENPPLNFQPVPQMQPAELSGLFTQQYGWRMAEPVAELLSLQLSRLDNILTHRRQGAIFWQQWAQEHGYQPPVVRADAQNSWLRFPLLLTGPKATTIDKLAAMLNVEIGVWFTTPMHPQACALPGCPTGMHAAKQCINLPTWLENIAGD